MSKNRPTADTMAVPLLWEDADVGTDDLMGQWDNRGSTSNLVFRSGTRLESTASPPLIEYAVDADRLAEFDLLASNGLIPLANARAADVISAAAGDDAELIPAKVRARGREIGRYWVVNATRLVRCIDKDASAYSMMLNAPDKILRFTRLRLLPGRMDGARLARDADYHGFLYVAPELASILLGARLRGLNLVSAEEEYAHFRNGPRPGPPGPTRTTPPTA